MNPALFTLGALMIAFGAVPNIFAMPQGHPTMPALVIAASLVAGGVALFFRRPASFWIALGAGLLTALAGAIGLARHRVIGLPVPPIASLVGGLYVTLRVSLARPSLRPTAPTPDDSPLD